MIEQDKISILSLNNIEQLNYDIEYEPEYDNPESTSAFATARDIPENNEVTTSAAFVTARSRDTTKSEFGIININPADVAIQLYDVFKSTENLCELSTIKFDHIEFNEVVNYIINQISSFCRFILPWNAVKLLLGIMWIKVLESLDGRDLTNLDNVKAYYLLKILKFKKPFLTVQRFAEILLYKPYNNINKFLNSTTKLLFIRESNYIKDPVDLLSNEDVIALVNIANKWEDMLAEKVQQMGSDNDESIWSSTEIDKYDKKDYQQPLDEDKINAQMSDDSSKRDIAEEHAECANDNIQSKRVKL